MLPPPIFFLILAGLTIIYLVLAEIVNNWFHKLYAYRSEQVLIPKRRIIYLSRTAKLVQNIVAVISLRFEDEISIDSLLEDLNMAVSYPIDSDQVARNLQHLRRVGLVRIDWHLRTIRREHALKECVNKNVLVGEMWSSISVDWDKINKAIQKKHGEGNAEF